MAPPDHRPHLARPREERTGGRVRAYNYEVGIKPLIEKAMGVQTFRRIVPARANSYDLLLGECRGDVALHRRRSDTNSSSRS